MIEIAVDTEKSFIIAQTSIEKRKLCDESALFHKDNPKAVVSVRANYDLYCSYYNDTENTIEKIVIGKTALPVTVDSQIFNNLFKKNKDGYCNLYWIAKDGITISVPWGCRICDTDVNGNELVEKGRGYNGEIKVIIDNIEKTARYFGAAYPEWEREYKDNNVVIDYLSEYFIDSIGNQRGLSIVLRDLFKDTIKNYLKNHCVDGVVSELIKKHANLLQQIGLKIKLEEQQ